MEPLVPTSIDELSFPDDNDIGKGASASVKVATSAGGGRYALKIVDKKKIVGQNQLTRLFREKDLLGTLRHASIVNFHATFKDEGHLYFLLELLPGGDLLYHMRQHRRSCLNACDVKIVLGALCVPLRHMQEQNILYRDLKPPNILFTASGRLKLVDFGHAKRIEGHALDEERSMSVIGTPHYQAPETVKGEGHGLPAQLWALGVLLGEMSMGVAPFWFGNGAASDEQNKRILAAEPDLHPLPQDAKALGKALLTAEPLARAAAFGGNGYAGVMAHDYFRDLDWAGVEDGSIVPGFSYGAHAAQLLGERAEPAPDEVESLSNVFADF